MKKVALINLLLLLLLTCCTTQDHKLNLEHERLIEANIINYLTYQNAKDKTNLNTIIAERFTRNMNGIQMVSNRNEHKASLQVFMVGFPDMIVTYPNKYIKDNEAFIHWIFTGTNTGVFGDVSATGKKVKIEGISHLYFNEYGKLIQEDVYYNELDLLQQIGYTLNRPIVE